MMQPHKPKDSDERSDAQPCAPADCSAGLSIEALNRSCYCVSVDQSKLRESIEAELGPAVGPALWQTHSNLFAASPVFIERDVLRRMEAAVAAIEEVVRTHTFQKAAATWAPEIAAYDPGSPGGLLGYDFHLTTEGPRLIEINTNPGGAFLNAVLARHQRLCCRDEEGFETALAGSAPDEALLEIFFREWRLQRGALPLTRLAIVDDSPKEQFLFPEFVLVQRLLERRGIEATICDPRELVLRGARLVRGETPVDLVYNRLTDFALEADEHSALRAAYLAGAVAVSPHPRAHALYADKRNLTLLCDGAFLERTGASKIAIEALKSVVPSTSLVDAANRDELWARRRELFFKPAAGYGSRAAYRGDKITKRVWEEIARAPYVAQNVAPPSERHLGPERDQVLKVDVRMYAYAGATKLVAARMYRGQTTNLRTPGGGFAPVLTQVARGSPNMSSGSRAP